MAMNRDRSDAHRIRLRRISGAHGLVMRRTGRRVRARLPPGWIATGTGGAPASRDLKVSRTRRPVSATVFDRIGLAAAGRIGWRRPLEGYGRPPGEVGERREGVRSLRRNLLDPEETAGSTFSAEALLRRRKSGRMRRAGAKRDLDRW